MVLVGDGLVYIMWGLQALWLCFSNSLNAPMVPQLRRLGNRHAHILTCLATGVQPEGSFRLILEIGACDLHDFITVAPDWQ